jgi:sporulation protein YlmC with PRC-barrel domain
MTTTHDATLYTLGDRGQRVEGLANDVRGREVKDIDGKGIGKVGDLLVDDQEHKVRFLVVEHGGFLGFGETTTLIPVDVVTTITDSEVFINQSREHVAGAPGYHPHLVDDRPYHSSVYGYYGTTPYWGRGYLYPGTWM